MAELFGNRTNGNGVQVETENDKFTVICSRSPQNLGFGHFTLLFGRRNVPKVIMHVKGFCFSYQILLFCDVLVAVEVVVS